MARAGTPPTLANAFGGRVVERLSDDLAAHPFAEDVHLDGLADVDPRVHPRVGDRSLHGVAVAAARDAAADHIADAHRLVAQRDRARVVADEAAQRAAGRRVERVTADVVLVALDAEAEPGLEWVDVRRDVGRPHAVALLEPQRVDRAVAAGGHAVRLARRPQRAPEARAAPRRAVQLPAELAHEGDAQRAHRHVADCDVAHAHVAE